VKRGRLTRDLLSDLGAVILSGLFGMIVVTTPGSLLAHRGTTAVVFIALSLCLLARRHRPLTVAWIAVAAAMVALGVELVAPGSFLHAYRGDYPPSDPRTIPWLAPMTPFAAYSAMGFARNRRAAVIVVAVLLVLAVRPGASSSILVTRSVLLVAVPALLGVYIAARRRLLHETTERAERAVREQHLLAERARADERARLAAEMHDIVTHRVSLMVLQAGALRVTAVDDATRTAAEDLRVAGCQALEELRDLVGILGDNTDDGTAVPTDGFAPLIASSASVGVPVELTEDGDPSLASPMIGRTAYRIVQEALTNVRKHAPGAQVQVHLRYRSDGVRLTVRNTASTRAVDDALAATGSGAGLLGLRRRVELIHGTLRAGVDREGGFEVEAMLPAYVPTAPRLEPAP
jgi:signal transduction histidine kinase